MEMARKYAFADGAIVCIKDSRSADPQTIGETLDAIRVARGGALKPEHVVEAARPTDHPLHRHFEWDDAVAAEAFRIDQARSMVRLVRIIADDGEMRPALVSLRAGDGVAYRDIDDVLRSSDMRARLLDSAERDLRSWQERYKELKDLVELAEPIRREISRRRSTKNESVNQAPA
jgi:hypothetical protein